MRIRRLRLTLPQLFLTCICGAAGGIYIWKPEFDRRYRKNISAEELELDRKETLANFDTNTEEKVAKI